MAPGDLLKQLEVPEEHTRLFLRILEILARSGVLEAAGQDFVVKIGAGDPLPENMPHDPEEFALRLIGLYPHGSNEIGLFRRCAGALAEVLRGREDPLSLLFGDEEPQAATLYRKAPVWKAANQMLGDVIGTIVAELPGGRRLRVLEVGAGHRVGDRLHPAGASGRTVQLYVYGYIRRLFADAEARFGDNDGAIGIPGAGY